MPDTSLAPARPRPRNRTADHADGKAKWDAVGCLAELEAETMCDEYDDERMRAFWRVLAEKEGLVVLPTETADEGPVVVKPLGFETEPHVKPKPRAMSR